jgi:isopentenyl-diphosphate delta-isomerase
MTEKIQIVDENDQPVGYATRQEAMAKGLYYRLAQIILEDENGTLLLQKRSPKKALYPNRWTNAASGHVDEGETYEIAAPRELKEEIGITVPLEYVGKFLIQRKEGDKTINQFNGVFKGHVPHDTPFRLEPEEVSEVRWFTVDELREKVASNPELFTPAMARVVQEFYAGIIGKR